MKKVLQFTAEGNVNKFVYVVLGLALMALVRAAHASAFVCWLDDGRRIFSSAGQGENCERIYVQSINPGNMHHAAATAPVRPVLSKPLAPVPQSAPASMVSPTNFPRIDIATQRARDFDRGKILEQELRFEYARLNEKRAAFNQGQPRRLPDEADTTAYDRRVARLREDIERSEDSIAALKREIALNK
jgi:hypothetical protein